MARNLFQSKNATIRKKMTILITAQNAQRLARVERLAEKAGVSFPVQAHMEEALERLLGRAERELEKIEVAGSPISHSDAVGPDISGTS